MIPSSPKLYPNVINHHYHHPNPHQKENTEITSLPLSLNDDNNQKIQSNNKQRNTKKENIYQMFDQNYYYY